MGPVTVPLDKALLSSYRVSIGYRDPSNMMLLGSTQDYLNTVCAVYNIREAPPTPNSGPSMLSLSF